MALQRTPDILAEIGKVKGSRFLVGFAAETEDLSRNARRKLEDKNLDLVVANYVAAPDGPGPGEAFGSDDNEVVVIDRLGNEDRWPRLSKRQVASRLMTLVAAKVAGKTSAG
jgi:phosphopantothenoylcysteine decarboxylase/phosphopantothenate--cysteine ligase